MANPATGDWHIDAALTNLSIGVQPDMEGFVADQVFPNVPVAKASDQYFEYDRASFSRPQMERVAPGAEVPEAGFDLSDDRYSVDVFKQDFPIPDETRANSDPAVSPEESGAQFLISQVMRNRERRFVSAFMSENVWGTDVTPTAKWDAAGNPVTDIRTAVDTIITNTGMKPNTIVMGRRAFSAAIDNINVRNRFEGGATTSEPSMAGKMLLASIFEVDRVLVSFANQNTANAGQTAVYSGIVDDDVLVCYVAPTPGIMMPSAGYHFVWDEYVKMTNGGVSMADNPMGLGLGIVRDYLRERDLLRIKMADDPKVTDTALGYFINDVRT